MQCRTPKNKIKICTASSENTVHIAGGKIQYTLLGANTLGTHCWRKTQYTLLEENTVHFARGNTIGRYTLLEDTTESCNGVISTTSRAENEDKKMFPDIFFILLPHEKVV